MAWVVDGSRSYFIVTGQVYDLELKVRKGIKNLESEENSPRMGSFNGHNGMVRKKV
ncbi:MAG: hypothetical protein RMI49_01220 [Candidatus Caldarchaeum sp.]|nr:hypothetical protein [Candidatus Caldarchaeum sp.]